MTCPECHTEVNESAKYCPCCGYNFTSIIDETSLSSMYCPICGDLIEPDAVFCPSCGSNIQDSTSQYTSLELTPEEKKVVCGDTSFNIEDKIEQIPPRNNVSEQPAQPIQNNNQGSKSSFHKVNKTLSALIGLFVLAGVCAGGYWLWNNKTNTNSIVEVDYMPFCESKDGYWGLIGKDGKVLFGSEFKNCPTIASHGRFWVKNNDGFWELFTAEKKPRRIGEQYDQAGAFIEDVAPVVAHNQPISFIDKNGVVKFTLTKVGDKSITSCTNFIGGVAVFKAGNKYGCINPKGEIIVEPEYDGIGPAYDGKMFAAKTDEIKEDKITIYILSTSGDVISSFSEDKFSYFDSIFVSGVAVAGKENENDDLRCGLIDENGEWVVKPSSNFHAISDIYEGYFIFYDGSNYGLANKKGEIIIRPKYKELKFARKGKLLFAKDNYKDSSWKLMSFDEETISFESFYDVECFIGNLAPVQVSEHNWDFINAKGEIHSTSTMIYALYTGELGDTEFKSQYLDVEEYANSLNINNDGFLGLSLNQNAKDIFDQLGKLTSESLGKEPKDFLYTSQISKTIQMEPSYGIFSASFGEKFVTEKNNYAVDDWGYEYVKSTEYFYNDKKPRRLELKIQRSGLLKGRMTPLASHVIDNVKSMGTVLKENKNAVVVKVGTNTWIVAYTGSELVISCGNIDSNSINIDNYKDVNEDSDVEFQISDKDQSTYDYGDLPNDTIVAVTSNLSGSKTLSGEVAGKKVMGNFYFYSDGSFTGSYGYYGNTSGISVRGNISNGHLYADEYNSSNDSYCGSYKGTVGGSSCSGTFINSKGNSYNFFWNFY